MTLVIVQLATQDCNPIIMVGPSTGHAPMEFEISEVVDELSDDDSVV
jgi:hypothetical protein